MQNIHQQYGNDFNCPGRVTALIARGGPGPFRTTIALDPTLLALRSWGQVDGDRVDRAPAGPDALQCVKRLRTVRVIVWVKGSSRVRPMTHSHEPAVNTCPRPLGMAKTGAMTVDVTRFGLVLRHDADNAGTGAV